MKRRIVAICGALLLVATATFAQHHPPRNINPGKHPNLAAAQRLVSEAFNKISVAQKANEFDMGGHAAKAKELLDEAGKELALAAEAANQQK